MRLSCCGLLLTLSSFGWSDAPWCLSTTAKRPLVSPSPPRLNRLTSVPPAARGYAGVAKDVRDSLAGATDVTAGVGRPPADAEGRCLTVHLPGGRSAVVGVNAPNAGVGLKRLAFQVEWDAALVALVSY
ncbi:hypothetical protein I4F81_002075 [Pyropia yezoensis]|uniref:Uncharacterized protein n=1 Tax=Pyropia yezoensis TaxID=2788 RepID=A0ACC3BP36_PYRYE|nr:hypothetical protein I4F81_002075 [Neopyropia yezoensis]